MGVFKPKSSSDIPVQSKTTPEIDYERLTELVVRIEKAQKDLLLAGESLLQSTRAAGLVAKQLNEAAVKASAVKPSRGW